MKALCLTTVLVLTLTVLHGKTSADDAFILVVLVIGSFTL